MKYNPKYVYFDWNEKLVGKSVLLADDIDTLKKWANGDIFLEPVKVEKSFDPKFPFLEPWANVQFKFCYYNPKIKSTN